MLLMIWLNLLETHKEFEYEVERLHEFKIKIFDWKYIPTKKST